MIEQWKFARRLKRSALSVGQYMLISKEKGNLISEARRKMKVEYEKKLADYAVQKKM
jgi:hypothetical protein